MIEGGVQTSSSLSAAPLGVPSPFLLQTGLEQALGFAAFHPMSPSTSSSSCSRVAGDDWPINDDEDAKTQRDSDGVSRHSVMQVPENWICCSTNSGHYGESPFVESCGTGDATAVYSSDRSLLPTSQPEPVFFDDFSTTFESSSFVVCEDNYWDGYQREEQIDGCWSQQSPPFTASSSRFGRKSTPSRFRFGDTGVITTFGGGGSSFGRAGGRFDRRRKQPDVKRNRKSSSDAEGMSRSEGTEASKKSCRQRAHGEGSRHAVRSTAVAHAQSEITVEVDNLDISEKNLSNRRRKQPTSSRKRHSTAVDNLSSEASAETPKVEGASKKRTSSRFSRGTMESSLKRQNSAVC